MKNIVILGSTGSIGTQTLEVVEEQLDIQVVGLSANTNIDLLEKQILKYQPICVAVMDEEKAQILQNRLGEKIKVWVGMVGLKKLATLAEADIVVTAVVGMIGLVPTVEAIKAGKDIALANKETLVTAGALIMDLVKAYHVQLLPVDSEHSAIFQSLNGENLNKIERIVITASGGPFRGYTKEALEQVTKEQALRHPNWSMGAKISIDSSTLVNKGLEVIEAKWLFDLQPEQISVVVHKESIVHSLVEFVDGSMIAQLGLPDMKLPIQYALGYPERLENKYQRLKLEDIGQLSFEAPNKKVFKGLQLAYDAIEKGGSLPIVYNVANEVAVDLFLKEKLRYVEIVELIEYAMVNHPSMPFESVEAILDVEQWTRDFIRNR